VSARRLMLARTGMLRLVAAMAVIGLFGACDALAEVAPQPRPSATFLEWLGVQGQEFTPGDPPAGAVASEEVMEAFRTTFPRFAAAWRADAPIYGVVSCVDATCDPEGGVGRDTVAIWLIGFPDAPLSSGGTSWAAYDAETGEFIVGDGPRMRPG
jgi:hypothetical protein